MRYIELVEEKQAQTEADDRKTDTIIVVGDSIMQRLLAVWPSVFRDYDSEANVDPLCNIWDHCTFSYNDWVDLASLPASPGNLKRAENLVRLGFVFPDGSIHHWVRALLRMIVLDLAGANKGKGKVGPRKEKPCEPNA